VRIGLFVLLCGCGDKDGGSTPAPVEDDQDTPVDDTGEGCLEGTWYRDADDDGYGEDETETHGCWPGEGWVDQGGDCDDTDKDRSPDAVEICDSVDLDEDCDGLADDDDPDVEHDPTEIWFPDADEDGYGDETSAGRGACDDPSTVGDRWVQQVAGDCDDGDAEVNPAAVERCFDGKDNDCVAETVCDWAEPHESEEVGLLLEGPAASSGALAGQVVAVADVDGDGADDLIAASKDAASTDGRVWVMQQGVRGGVLTAESVILTAGTGDGLGSAVARVPDLDGDGLAELLVGASTEQTLSGTAGAVWLLHGPITGDLDLSTELEVALGESENARAGRTLAAGPDATGDGLADLLVAAPLASGAAGRVYLHSGAWSGTLSLDTVSTRFEGEATWDELASAALVEDLDGDGVSEVVLGAGWADGERGRVGVFRGPLSGTASLADADGLYEGDESSSGLGFELEVADLDGDGFVELIMPMAPLGTIWVLPGDLDGEGPVSDHAELKLGDDAGFGESVVALGDLDGDGLSELAVGSTQDQDVLFVFAGPWAGVLSGEDSALRVDATRSGQAYASSLAAGDLDQDGTTELVVGSPGADGSLPGSDVGAVWLLVLSEDGS